MAADNIVTPAENLGAIKAGTDLTGGQFLAVTVGGAGVRYHVVATSGQCLVLYNTPASGEAVQAYAVPNVVKAKAGGALTAGAWVTITGSSAFQASSDGAATGTLVGVARTAASSGDIFSLRLI